MLTFSQAIERCKCFKRAGLVKKAQHLIENIDNVLTCRNIDMRRNENTVFHISTRLKLKMYKHQIIAGSNDHDVRYVVSVAKFLEDNKEYLVDELAKRRLEPSDIIVIPDCDSEDGLPDLVDSPDIEPLQPQIESQPESQTESHMPRTPVRGIRGFHRYRPYRVSSSAPTPPPTPTPTHTATVTLSSNESRLVSPSVNEEKYLIQRIRQNVRREILQCVICVNYDKDSVLVPCGHFFCNSCAMRIKEHLVCGFCRTKINTIAQVRLTNFFKALFFFC